MAAERIGPRVAGATVQGWSRLRCRTFVHVTTPAGRDVIEVAETAEGWRVHLQDSRDAPTVTDPEAQMAELGNWLAEQFKAAIAREILADPVVTSDDSFTD